MKVLVVLFSLLLASVECSVLQTYSLPNKDSARRSHHGNQGYQYLPPATVCAEDQVLHVDGQCVTPVITRSVYLFNAPQLPPRPTPKPYIPLPKIDHNIVFVRLPDTLRSPDPIVVPPPQQKNIVYVLKKKTQDDGPRVIEVPAPPKTNPDVYFVGYDQGENPILPTGEDLEGALAQNAQEIFGQVVDSWSSGNIADSESHSHNNLGSFDQMGTGSHSQVGIGSFGHVGSGSHNQVDTGSFGEVDSGSHSQVGIGLFGQAGSGLSGPAALGLFGQLNTGSHRQVNTGSFGQVDTGLHSQVGIGSFGQAGSGSHSLADLGSFGELNTGSHSQLNIGSFGQMDTGSQSHVGFGSFGQVESKSHSFVDTGSLDQEDDGSQFEVQDNKSSSPFMDNGSLGHSGLGYYFPPHK